MISMTPISNELQERGRWRGSGSHSARGQVGSSKSFLSNFETIPGTGQATLPRHMGCTGRGLGTGTCVKTICIKLKKCLYVPIFSFRAMILIDQDGLVAARQVRNCHLAHLGLSESSNVSRCHPGKLYYNSEHAQVGDLPSGLGAREAKRLLSSLKQQGERRHMSDLA